MRLRYRSAPDSRAPSSAITAPATPGWSSTLEREVGGAAPGQTACLMGGDRVVGWAPIAERRRLLGVPSRIELEAPLDGRFGPVVRLIVGGIAERADFGFEAMDDLQLAIERLLAEAGSDGHVSLSFELGEAVDPRARGPAARARPRRGARKPTPRPAS